MFQCFAVTFQDNIAASYYCLIIRYDKVQEQQDENT